MPATKLLDDGTGWPTRVVDTVQQVTKQTNRFVVEPLKILSTALVVGAFIAIVAGVMSVMLMIALFRLIDTYLFPGISWATDFLVGGILLAGALLLWKKRA